MKKWYLSKTLYANVLSMIGVVVYNALGQDYLTVEAQVGLLAVINVVLRVITKEEITW